MPTQTMTAVRLHEFGGPEVLRVDEVPTPVPGPGEVLVAVRAIGVNPPDWYVREGFPGVPEEVVPRPALPLIPGSDVSGVVAALNGDADEVGGFAVGDEVFGMLRFPGMDAAADAEYVAAPVSDLARKPAGIDHVHAAGAPMAGLTAWQFLVELGHDEPNPFQTMPHRPAPLGPGTRVLVNGAAGGVGHLALQLAKGRGAYVIAVASGGHEQFLRGLGADEFIDYTTTRPEDVAHDLDVVLDTVGGAASARLLPMLRRGGSLFPVYMAEFDPDEVAARGVTTSSTQVRASGAQLGELARLLDSGAVRVAIEETFALDDAAKAHERAARGHLRGKIVLTVA